MCKLVELFATLLSPSSALWVSCCICSSKLSFDSARFRIEVTLGLSFWDFSPAMFGAHFRGDPMWYSFSVSDSSSSSISCIELPSTPSKKVGSTFDLGSSSLLKTQLSPSLTKRKKQLLIKSPMNFYPGQHCFPNIFVHTSSFQDFMFHIIRSIYLRGNIIRSELCSIQMQFSSYN